MAGVKTSAQGPGRESDQSVGHPRHRSSQYWAASPRQLESNPIITDESKESSSTEVKNGKRLKKAIKVGYG
jgi:hypothetical protein